MWGSVEQVAPNIENRAIVESESRHPAAIIPTQERRQTRRHHEASCSGEVYPGPYEAGMPHPSLQGRTCGVAWTDLPGARRVHNKDF